MGRRKKERPNCLNWASGHRHEVKRSIREDIQEMEKSLP